MINYVKEGSSEFKLDKYEIEARLGCSNRDPKRPLNVGDKLYYLPHTVCYCFTLVEINYDHKKPFYMWDERIVSPLSLEYKLYCPKTYSFFANANFVPVEDKFESKVVKREIIKRGRKGRV